MDKSCKLLLSDHERCIICFSTEPYPTWIWTAEDITQPIAPSEMAEGEIYKCEEKDREELAEFAEMFHDETGIGRMDKEGYLKYAEEKIADGRTFFWKDAHLANRNTKENTLSY